MELKWKIHQYTFKPTAYDTGETRAIMGVKRGTLVKNVMLRVGEAFNNASISIGDGSNTAGFMSTTQAACTVAGLKNGAGVYLATEDTDVGTGTPACGKLYTEDDTVDLTYATTDAPTQGLATVYVVYAELE